MPKKQNTDTFQGSKLHIICEENKSFKKLTAQRKILLYCILGGVSIFLFGIVFNVFGGLLENFFMENTQRSAAVALATEHTTYSTYGLLEPCTFIKTEQNEIFLRFLNKTKILENSSNNLPATTDVFISFEEFCAYFPAFHDFVSTNEFKDIVFRLPAGKINFCLLLKECFLNDLCWIDLPKTYKIIICFFIDFLGSTNAGQLYFITETSTVDIFFNLKTTQEAFAMVKEFILSNPIVCSSEQAGLEIKQFFHKFDFYLNYLQSYEISDIGLSEFMHRMCSSVYTRCFSVEWLLFYSDTIEIYILWNWLLWSIAFVATVYYCFRPNTLFYTFVLATMPLANFVFVPVYICILLYFKYC